jgi:hypothetical protein
VQAKASRTKSIIHFHHVAGAARDYFALREKRELISARIRPRAEATQ